MKAGPFRDRYFFQWGRSRNARGPRLLLKVLPVLIWNHALGSDVAICMCFLGMLVKTISPLVKVPKGRLKVARHETKWSAGYARGSDERPAFSRTTGCFGA